nr:PREDICTED: interleukin-17 receptor E-like [Paralichthys olivaceus]
MRLGSALASISALMFLLQLEYTPTCQWELCDCVKVSAEKVVSVSYSTTSTSCNVSYSVPNPVPQFALSVNRSVKSITVTVEQGEKVHTRWCYLRSECIVESPSPRITIDPSQSRSAVLHIPYLLPCVCVQVYYTHTDARREKQCPFQKETLTDVEDVWRSSEVIMYESVLKWSSECPVSSMNISALLCWKQDEHLCIPVLNSTLDRHENGPTLIYNTSTVDKHPKMCVQFSLQGSYNISCPFQADMSSWEVNIGSGRQSVSVKLTSLAPAKFSIQFCIINQMRCSPIGPVHTLRMERETTETKLKVPAHILVQAPCVQVWQSHPALNGKRILCPDYARNRFGLYVMAALILVIIFALFGFFIHCLTRSGAAGWLWIQKEVLLVCSSEQSAHVSAVCALASVLQEELKATVHTALWAQSSQPGARTGVADVGPLPWLYGQWESMHKAQGKVLIIWSPEAKTTYEKWKARENVDKSETKKEKGLEVEEDYKLNGIRLGKGKKKERAAFKEDCVKLCHDKDFYTQREPCSVIAPVFAGALACLHGSLQHCRGQGVAIVYFQGFGHSRDIPKALRDVPRYCLPQDFRGLIQELGGMKRGTKSKRHCWPRLMSKVQSIWLARQLAQRLQTLLPRTQGQKTQSVTSSQKKMTEKTELSLAADEASPETVQEQEPLQGSPWTAERL